MKHIFSRSFAFALCLLLSLSAVLGGCFGPSHKITLSTKNGTVTATVMKGKTAAPGENIAFTWQVRGESGGPQVGQITATNASGQGTFILERDLFRSTTITVTATLASNPKISARTTIKMPAVFIALSDAPMNWNDAGTWCQQRGGKLPRINNSDSWAWVDRKQVIRIDGFGDVGRPWAEVGLPFDWYWTGTENSDSPGLSWIVDDYGGGVSIVDRRQSAALRAACVPP